MATTRAGEKTGLSQLYGISDVAKIRIFDGPEFRPRKTQLVLVKPDMSKILEKIVLENSGVMAKTGQKTAKIRHFWFFSKIAIGTTWYFRRYLEW